MGFSPLFWIFAQTRGGKKPHFPGVIPFCVSHTAYYTVNNGVKKSQ
jgi:hypothetical protein